MLIKEIENCRECPYFRSRITKSNNEEIIQCVNRPFWCVLHGADKKYLFEGCPLQETDSGNRMIMEEIKSCTKCPYFYNVLGAPTSCHLTHIPPYSCREYIKPECSLPDVLPKE